MSPDSQRARYFALLYSPARERAVLEALLGLEREITASLRPGLDHQVAHSRLQWWLEECGRCAQGKAMHPLTQKLTTACGSAQALGGLSGLVDTAIWDLARATFETRTELTAYCGRWTAAMLEPFNATAAIPILTPLRALGAALRELELLNALASDAQAGKLRLPLDELDRGGAEPAVLAEPPWPRALAELVRSRHEVLRAASAQAVAAFSAEQQARLRGLMVWAALTCRASARAQRSLPDQARQRRSVVLADAWHAWRSARQAIHGALQACNGRG
jgi:phytoene synthase